MTKVTRRHLGVLLAGLTSGGKALAQAKPYTPSIPPYSGPWAPLFNGRDLSEWEFWQDGVGAVDKTNAVVLDEEGMLHVLGPKHTGSGLVGFGYLATKREFENYHLRFDVLFGARTFEPQLLQARNNGLFYHVGLREDPVWPDCIECQLQEGEMGDASLLNRRCWPGFPRNIRAWPLQEGPPQAPFPAVTDPPVLQRQAVKRIGEGFEHIDQWNTLEILCVGDRSAHILNGRLVNSLFKIEGRDPKDRQTWRPLTKGRIAIEIEGAETLFKDMMIRPLAV